MLAKLPAIKTPIKLFFGFLILIFLLALVAEGGYYLGYRKGTGENSEEEIARKADEYANGYSEGIMYYGILGETRYGLAIGQVRKIEGRFLTIEGDDEMIIKISEEAEVFRSRNNRPELIEKEGFSQIKEGDKIQVGKLKTDENGVLIGGTVLIE